MKFLFFYRFLWVSYLIFAYCKWYFVYSSIFYFIFLLYLVYSCFFYTVCFLGITYNHGLIKTSQSIIGFLSLLSHELRAALVVSLIFPLVDVCCLLYNDLTGELNAKIERFINYGISLVFNLRWDKHITPYRRRLGWLTVKTDRFYFISLRVRKCGFTHASRAEIRIFTPRDIKFRTILGCTLFEILQGKALWLSFLSALLALSVLHTSFSLNSICCPSVSYLKYQYSFYVTAIYFCHSLSASVVSKPMLDVFKDHLHAHLFVLEG